MEIVLALCAAAVYGVADYSGGRASRTVSPVTVTAIGQGCGLIFLLVIVLACLCTFTADTVKDF